MTVVVAFHCTDGVVLGADSMLTPSMGNIAVGHHHGKKVSVLDGPQLFAFAGDQGQSERIRIMANASHTLIVQKIHAIDYPLAITNSIIQQFNNTGIGNAINTNPVLGYEHNGTHHCCIFEGMVQPRLLDCDHYYAALGSGKLSADPFLRFLTDIFCENGQPTVVEAIFLTTWVIQHVIEVNPGGVAAPIRIATLQENGGHYEANVLPENEIDEHLVAIESAASALKDWRDDMQTGESAENAPTQPEAPKTLVNNPG